MISIGYYQYKQSVKLHDIGTFEMLHCVLTFENVISYWIMSLLQHNIIIYTFWET